MNTNDLENLFDEHCLSHRDAQLSDSHIHGLADRFFR
jgi:hypothetical protein